MKGDQGKRGGPLPSLTIPTGPPERSRARVSSPMGGGGEEEINLKPGGKGRERKRRLLLNGQLPTPRAAMKGSGDCFF